MSLLRRTLMAASMPSGGGGGELNFPIVITTDYCEDDEYIVGLVFCYKNLADDGAFYDALLQFLKANTKYPEDDDYFEYESSEPIIIVDNIEFYNMFYIAGDDYVYCENSKDGMCNMYIHNNGMIELEKWG